jgi:hypothetical protein
MFAARATVTRVSDAYRAESEAGADSPYDRRGQATTSSEQ